VRRGNVKPKPEYKAAPRLFSRVTMPLAIAKALYAAASLDDGRKMLCKTVEVREAANTTVFAATDTHVLIVATAPTKYEIADGLYFHEFAPFRYEAAGALLLSTLDLTFPDWRKRILPETGMVTKQIGTFNNEKQGLFTRPYGRIEIAGGDFCVNFNVLGKLAPSDYSVHYVTEHTEQKNSTLYLFDGCIDDWKIRYVISGMVRSDFVPGVTP
jgi:hypothetical protein